MTQAGAFIVTPLHIGRLFDVGCAKDLSEADLEEINVPVTVSYSLAPWAWDFYPALLEKPLAPLTMIKGEAYEVARKSTNKSNRSIRAKSPEWSKAEWNHEVHELHPVKFGGSPTAAENKVVIPAEVHYEFTAWWNDLQKNIESQAPWLK